MLEYFEVGGRSFTWRELELVVDKLKLDDKHVLGGYGAF